MTDQIPQNNRERITSGDINDRQDIVSRQLAEYLRNMGAQRTFIGDALPSEAPRNIVFGGYSLTPGVGDVLISRGAMAVEDALLPAAPRTYESAHRVLVNTESTTLSLGGAADGFALVVAAPEQSDTLVEARDIWDPVLNVFTSTPGQVKARVQRAAFSLASAGSPSIPAYTAAQNALWVVLISGGSVAGAIDLRRVPESSATGGIATVSRRGLQMLDRDDVRFDVAAEINGYRLHHKSGTAATLQLFAEDALVIANSTTYYLYLGVGGVDGNFAPVGSYAGADSRGILVVSTTAPDPVTLLNTGTITGAAALTSQGIVAGNAICVGCVRTTLNTAGNGETQECSAAGRGRINFGTGVGVWSASLDAANNLLDLSSDTNGGPIGVRSLAVRLSSNSGSTVAFGTVTLSTGGSQIEAFTYAQDHASIRSDIEINLTRGRSFTRAPGNWGTAGRYSIIGYQW